MSTQINQYVIWGISLPYKDAPKACGCDGADEFYEKFRRFSDDSAYESIVNHEDGIFLLNDGRDGRFTIIGRVLAKAKDGEYLGRDVPFSFEPLTPLEKELIQGSIKRNFGIIGYPKLYVVTRFR